MRSHRHSTALAALALGASLTLTGCFSNPLDGLLEGGVESIIENATGGLVGGSQGELPKDFPTEVPVIDGEVQGGITIGVEDSRTWTVNVSAPGGTVDEVAAHVASQFAAAGFEASSIDASFAGRSVTTYSKGDLTALVTVADDESTNPTVTYIANRKN